MESTTTEPPIANDYGNDVLIWIPSLLVCLVALPVNGFVLFVIIYSRLVLSRQNACVVLLILCDLCRCFLALTSMLIFMADTAAVGHQDFCNMISFLQSFVSGLNCSAVCLLLYDRILFMSSPINYHHKMSRRMLTGMVTYAIVHAILPASLPLMGWGHFQFDRHYVTCDVDWTDPSTYPQFFLIWTTCIPLLVSACCLAKVYLLFRQRTRRIKIHGNMQNTLKPLGIHVCMDRGSITDADRAFLKTTRLLTVLAIFYYISWLTRLILVARLMTGPGAASLSGYSIATMITFLTNTVNPFMCGIYNHKFRRTIKKIVTCGKISETDIRDITPFQCRSISELASHSYSGGGREVPNGLPRRNTPLVFSTIPLNPEEVSVTLPGVRSVWN